MNVAVPRNAKGRTDGGAESFLARFDGMSGRLPGDPAVREAAARVLRTAGLPTIRDEVWKYTSLRPVTDLSFSEPLDAIEPSPALDALVAEVPRLVFVNGRFRKDLSVFPAGVAVDSFARRPEFGSLTEPGREPLVALNTMLAEDGVVLSVVEGADAGLVQLVSVGSDAQGRSVAFHPRHAIRLARGARMTLLESSSGSGTYLHNPVTEVHVAAGAALMHVRLQNESRAAFNLSTLYAEVAEGGTYDSFALNLGARLSRTEIHARLAGANGSLHLNGAQLMGSGQHADFTTVVSHEAPSCASRQTVKNVLTERSRGVFQGKIFVARAAQKTDGYQMNQALLLSPEAEIDSKPQLEIYADDVKCSHGATVGELDLDQIFYLRSRGVPEPAARSILVRAFLAEALEAVADERIRGVLDRAVESWWERQAA